MDRITRLLIRFASLVVILSGLGGLSIYAFKSGIFKNPEFLSFNNLSNKIKSPNKIIKKGSCPKTHNYSIDKFCMNEKGYEMHRKEKGLLRKNALQEQKQESNLMPFVMIPSSQANISLP